ncbi:hypothetical protein LU290_03230 [Moraxella nasibovis]|uniref:hypothetical protein n=1 Tax=Moraxella nasibovis TaxID=2904120 RepID=UPI0024105D3F|nr:hypothetical protein [Moraxella nasibovis]WFF39248.1 hypothetical protein LU290_03230 [Moraxella nasibovis]
MSDLILYLYLIDIFGNLSFALMFVLFVLLAALTVATIIMASHADIYGFDEVKPFLYKVYIPALLVFCVLGLLKIAVPSKQTMYTALGLYTANQVMQQPQMVEVGNQAMRILQAKLDEYEKELMEKDE